MVLLSQFIDLFLDDERRHQLFSLSHSLVIPNLQFVQELFVPFLILYLLFSLMGFDFDLELISLVFKPLLRL